MGLPKELRAKDIKKKLEFVRSLQDDDPSYYQHEGAPSTPLHTSEKHRKISQVAQFYSPKITVYHDHPDYHIPHAEKRAALFGGEPDILSEVAKENMAAPTSDTNEEEYHT